MEDRIPTNPGRVKITPENGGPSYYATLEMADEPSQVGTPLNKKTLLDDAVAQLYQLTGAQATPSEVFKKIFGFNHMPRELLRAQSPQANEYTVPYKIHKLIAFIIDGGSSGDAYYGEPLRGLNAGVRGGSPGEMVCTFLSVNPGQKIKYVVGAGGSPAVSDVYNEYARGNPGGASSFNGVTTADAIYSKEEKLYNGDYGNLRDSKATNLPIVFDAMIKLLLSLYDIKSLPTYLISGNDAIHEGTSKLKIMPNGRKGSRSITTREKNAINYNYGDDCACGGGAAYAEFSTDKGGQAASCRGEAGAVIIWGW